MLKIAVITNSTSFSDEIKPILTNDGYEVSLYLIGENGIIDSLIETKVEFAIIDFFTDTKASHTFLQDIKADESSSNIHCMAIFDEPPGDEFDFKLGIDDFIFKDSITRDLSLKIGLFQWKRHSIDSKDKIVIKEFVIDNSTYEVTFKGEKVTLTYKEFELLKFLITHRGRAYSRDALLNQVWGYNYYGGTRTVDVHIRRLRSKIGISMDKYLKTIRNVGYIFEC